ncbi:hypothetical protein T484DRAFT_1852053 [Baffinella frigidus]|nr:hypothetical protein T484DRAFT_1852053 [Cryptophyta sp. CCMP2293]
MVLLACVDRLITQLFVWFGAYAFEGDIEPWQADDTEFVDNVPPTHALALTNMGIKFYLNIFFVLFRLLFLQRHAVAVPRRTAAEPIVEPTTGLAAGSGLAAESGLAAGFGLAAESGLAAGSGLATGSGGGYPFSVESFHVEAGVDDFHMIGMYFDIPAGCLLEYKHSYSGYYNNVSQCVYRHFPTYTRRKPVSLAEVSLEDASDLSVLPALKQIYPEIQFAFEDHHFERERVMGRVVVVVVVLVVVVALKVGVA